MTPIVILLIGMVVVVAGVLVLRVHAFLALIAGALIVSILTPRENVYEHELRQAAVSVSNIEDDGTIVLGKGTASGLVDGSTFIALRRLDSSRRYEPVGRIQIDRAEGSSSRARFHAEGDSDRLDSDDFVVPPAAQLQAQRTSNQSIGEHVAYGFGRTCMGIGILIAMAAIIGKCLLDSGGAERVVLGMRRALGEERAAHAFLGSGFVVAIPVFFDTVFYLLVPLAKAMRVKTGKHYLLYVLTIVAGAALAHSLIPPTPGPLFVASELGVDLGLMILGGLVVGLIALPVGYLFSRWADRRWDIPLRPSVELPAEELEAMAHRDPAALPPLWLSLLPIVLPVVLIAGNTILGIVATGQPENGWLATIVPMANLIGDKNVALVIAAVVALLLLVRQSGHDPAALKTAVQAALMSGGVIILITAAGGAFGHVLRLTGISEELKNIVPTTHLVLIPAAFAMTTLVRIAQGSATVAMITAVGLFAPIVAAGGLAFHPLYIALAIGCGSMPYPWMNDSGFWIISTMSGFTEGETLKTASAVIALMGFAGLIATVIGAVFVPLS
ncbi:MAG TPA: SLC13 family permease [Rhodothermales bacterium]|nr:SLC13 family permease [Rhodothermales bacterium]